ncbi:MAG: tRNA (adenosine(37)-N6)-threonylcarbamoyltransferase complex transferase subunit TsaD [Chloroflexota bacterium]
MLALGIETSCDETSAAVVEDGRRVLSSIVSSQIPHHAPYGGVVPEIASRQHVLAIRGVVALALETAGVGRNEVQAIAVTQGPGLAGALLVGLSFARGLAMALDVPLFPVNHLEGHLHSVWLSRATPLPDPPPLPMLALIVSGGHTELVVMRDHGDNLVIGKTVDDAAGEAFDKVARVLGLPYPGGPEIERVAATAGHPEALPRAWLRGTHNFSFSGLKTATLRAFRDHLSVAHRISPENPTGAGQSLPPEEIANLAAGFQESVIDVLVKKSINAAVEHRARSIAVVGGVAANGALRDRMRSASPVPLLVSPPEFATDNAAMIASAGFYLPATRAAIDVLPSLSLDQR